MEILELNEKGYTILELMMVIAFLGLLIALALPSSGIIRGLTEVNELKAFEKNLTQARNTSIVEKRTVYITLDPKENSYLINYNSREIIKKHRFKPGVDVRGATLIQFHFNASGSMADAQTILFKLSNGDAYIMPLAPVTTTIRLEKIN